MSAKWTPGEAAAVRKAFEDRWEALTDARWSDYEAALGRFLSRTVIRSFEAAARAEKAHRPPTVKQLEDWCRDYVSRAALATRPEAGQCRRCQGRGGITLVLRYLPKGDPRLDALGEGESAPYGHKRVLIRPERGRALGLYPYEVWARCGDCREWHGTVSVREWVARYGHGFHDLRGELYRPLYERLSADMTEEDASWSS